MKELKILFDSEFLNKEPLILVAATCFGCMFAVLSLMLCAAFWLNVITGFITIAVTALPVCMVLMILKFMIRSSPYYREE